MSDISTEDKVAVVNALKEIDSTTSVNSNSLKVSDISTEDKVAVINALKEIDICDRCILRYLGVKINEGLIDGYLEAEEKLLSFESENNSFTSPPKRIKRNPCRSCLGMLDDATLERYVSKISFKDVHPYKYGSFSVNVNMPKCVAFRNKSVFIYLKEKFPNLPLVCPSPHTGSCLKRVVKLASNDALSKRMGMIHRVKSSFRVDIEVRYDDDEDELKNVKKFKSQKELGKLVIENIIEKCDNKTFKEMFPVPPDIPIKETDAEVRFSTDPIFIGGRYLKFSRNIGQTPFIINNRPITEHSVQEIMFDSINKILGSSYNMRFSASGREDVDVRMLGNGRPFYIQIDNPKDPYISFERFREIEEEIFKTKLVAVVKLQMVNAVDLNKIKCGEEHKKKHYSAICHTTALDLDPVVKAINVYNNQCLNVDQKTPLRVLHRRTTDVRKKVIYSMKASLIPDHPNLILVEMITQAGTYVKEFVNSDFHRTQPSISTLIGYPIDVIALDVTKIHLKWP